MEDRAADLEPGQMRKGEFLAQLHDVVCPTAEAALAGTAWSSMGCPWIDHWFAYYGQRSAAQVEASLRKYAGPGGVTAAADYIPMVAGRVRAAIEQWAAGDDVSDIPSAISRDVASPEEGEEEPLVCEPPGSAGAASGLFSRLGGMLMKRRTGATEAAGADPGEALERLGSGRSLDAGVRRRMEGAFGADFSRVRLHTGARGGRTAGDLGARAFAVGEHVAFAPGEYSPGTPVGDALIAHELAHVVQQGGAGSPAAKPHGPGDVNALEEDADRSAVGAVLRLWTGLPGRVGASFPRLRSGLELQGCFLKDCGSGDREREREREEEPEEKKAPWWEEEIKAGPAAGVYVRSPYSVAQLQHLLRQVEVLVEAGETSVKKTPPGESNWQFFHRAQVKPTQWTPKEIKEQVAGIFPPGGEVYVWKKTGGGILGRIEKIIEGFRKEHPNTFSNLQGRAMLREATTTNCIEACNQAFSELYGPRAMPSDPEHFGTTVQGTIKKLKEQKLVAASKTFKAEYVGAEGDRFQIIEPADLAKVKFGGAGAWVAEQVKALDEDGVVAFAVNLSNGFHSASIVAQKQGSKIVLAWKDQGGAFITDPASIDGKVRHYIRIRYRYWLRKGYNDLFDPNVESVDDITDDAKQKKAEERIKSSVLADVAINEFARVKPL